MLEVKQLEGQAQRILTRLGNEAYLAFVERDQAAIDRDTPEIKAILTELFGVKDAIEKKEADLKNRK
jgi:hypothetical protein